MAEPGGPHSLAFRSSLRDPLASSVPQLSTGIVSAGADPSSEVLMDAFQRFLASKEQRGAFDRRAEEPRLGKKTVPGSTLDMGCGCHHTLGLQFLD
jgi:hypothetical protein